MPDKYLLHHLPLHLDMDLSTSCVDISISDLDLIALHVYQLRRMFVYPDNSPFDIIQGIQGNKHRCHPLLLCAFEQLTPGQVER